ncbi:MAG: chromosomal replication initiator protein DnaA [Clostridiales bacterium]|nr:chromosomal replication initiator protein DnaA [Clostridiales bacterium]
MKLLENWNNVLNLIEKEVTAVSFDLWIKTLKPLAVKDDEIIIYAPSVMAKNQCEKNFINLIRFGLDSTFKDEYKGFKIITGEEEKNKFLKEELVGELPEENKKTTNNYRTNLNPKYTFNNFVVGKSNQIVYAACKNVADHPSCRFNPLFVYGGVGLGKTHLLHAIGNQIIKDDPQMKVLYVTCEQFTNDYIDAIRSNFKDNAISVFRDKYRNVDVLLVDDIQFISKKIETQENFFHTFNDLYQQNKQIVIASDRPPKEIETLSDRLESRLSSGLIQDIGSPDFETRVAILIKKAQIENYNVQSEVIDYLAENYDSNVRELEGCLSQVVFYANLMGHHFADINDAKEALKNVKKDEKAQVTMDKIINVCCEYYNVNKQDLVGKKKNKEIVDPRQIAMYLITEILDAPLVSIGRVFGNRDHTTVMHARDKVARLVQDNIKLKNEIVELKEKIKSSQNKK